MPKKLANVVIVLVLIFGAISLFSGRLFPHSVDVGIAGTNGVSLPEGGRSESHAPGSQDSLALTDSNGVSSTDNPPYITKVTMLYGERNEVYERALQSHVRHGDIHGYPVRVLRQRMLGRLWTKPAWLLSIVLEEMAKPPGKRIEWIFWFDADTVIANPDIPLEIFVPPEPEYGHIHFLCGNDHNGLNDGAFLLRIGDYALHMLAAALSVESFRPEVDLKYSEQSAIEHVVTAGDVYRPWDGARYIDGYAKIPQRWMNAYMGARDEHGMPDKKKRPHSNSIHEGDLLLHFAGSGDTKRQRMSAFMDSWEADSSPWRKPVESTNLEKEITSFWKDFAKVDARRQDEKQWQEVEAKE